MNDTAIDVIQLQATTRVDHQALSGSSSQQLYDSLPVIATDQSIRLLDLDALPRGSTIDTNNVPLTGTLRVVSLKSSPSFAALSYVWRTWKSFLNLFLAAHSRLSTYMGVVLRGGMGLVWFC